MGWTTKYNTSNLDLATSLKTAAGFEVSIAEAQDLVVLEDYEIVALTGIERWDWYVGEQCAMNGALSL